MLHERVQVFIPREQTKSLSMRLPVAPQSKRALMEWSSLVSVVPISTGRSKEVPHASNALIERSLGSLFSHLGLRSRAGTRGVRGGASISLLSIVLGSSIVNTVNLFTGDRGVLIAGRPTQNPFLPEDKFLLLGLYLSMPADPPSAPPIAPRWIDRCPCGGDSLGLDSLHLCISSIPAEARTLFSYLHRRP